MSEEGEQTAWTLLSLFQRLISCVSFLCLFIHQMHETGLLLYTLDNVKTKIWALQHFKEFPDGFLKQPYNTCMCSNHTALAWAAVMHHLHVQQSCISHMYNNHTVLTCAAIIHHLNVQQLHITCMCSNHTSLTCAAIMHLSHVQQSYIT